MARGKGGRAGVEVEGGPELRRAFRRMGGRAEDLSRAHRKGAEIVARRARDLAPRVTGALIGTIRTQARTTGGAVVAGGTTLVPYAGPIHFGWRARNIEPQPFLYDAAADERDEVAETYEAEIALLVRRFDSEAPD